jgi:hypothetical protein
MLEDPQLNYYYLLVPYYFKHLGFGIPCVTLRLHWEHSDLLLARERKNRLCS